MFRETASAATWISSSGPPGRRAHHRCKMLGCPCRIDFSRADALFDRLERQGDFDEFLRHANSVARRTIPWVCRMMIGWFGQTTCLPVNGLQYFRIGVARFTITASQLTIGVRVGPPSMGRSRGIARRLSVDLGPPVDRFQRSVDRLSIDLSAGNPRRSSITLALSSIVNR